MEKYLKGIIIAVDFDGTCVTHEFPKVGRAIGAEPVLKEFIAAGARLVLWTMRSGTSMDDAVAWFKERNIPLWGINNNPTQHEWTTSRKVYAHFYIDDAAVGTPKKKGRQGERDYVNWQRIRKLILPEA